MAKYTLIKCGKMFDGVHEQLFENMDILIKDNLIEEVGVSIPYPQDAKIIDLTGKTVTPGMIDAHVHLSYIDMYPQKEDVIFNSDSYRALAALYSAQRCLAAGFTTVRHMGWFAEDNILDVRNLINRGVHVGSRIIAAPHMLSTRGSHGDGCQNMRSNPPMADVAFNCYVGSGCGRDFFVDIVRRERMIGADFLKIFATGGVMTTTDQPTDIQLNDEELGGIFDTAKALGMSVTAHCYGGEALKKLVALGIDGIEHGTMMDEDCARLMEANGTYVVPTFSPGEDIIMRGEAFADAANAGFIKFAQKAEELKRGRQVILDSNIKVGYGTDFVPGLRHYNFECGKEYWCLMNHGMEPFRILKAATSINADICGLGDKIGSIEKGKYADIAAWDADLLTDGYALTKCVFVMKEGVEHEAEYQFGKYCTFEDLNS